MPPSIPIESTQEAPSRLATEHLTPSKTSRRKKTNNVPRKSPNQTRLMTGASSRRRRVVAQEDSTGIQEEAEADPSGETMATADQIKNNGYNSNNSMMMPTGMSSYGGMYGGSPFYGGGMAGYPMMGMGGMGGAGPFSGVYQVLFGVQNVVFSLGQVVQILGMNQQALQQAFDSLTIMMDHAIATFHELRALETSQIEKETEEQKKRRRRLKAIRWALAVGTSWLVYKIIRRLTTSSRRRRLEYQNAADGATPPLHQHPSSMPYGGNMYGTVSSMFGPSMYGGGGYNTASPYGGGSMYGGGGYYGAGGSYY